MTYPDKFDEYDILIIGAGIAGISISYELKKLGIPSILIDAGNSTLSFNQNVDLDTGDFATKLRSRVNAVGGGSNLWGGLVTPFTTSEMMVDNENLWPISHTVLEEYYKKIDPAYCLPSFGQLTDLCKTNKVYFEGLRLKPFAAFKPAVNFRTQILEKYELPLIQDLRLLEVVNSGVEGKVDALIFYDKINDQKLKTDTSKKLVILATNSFESSRIVLNSKSITKCVNHSWVGHGLMNHPKAIVARSVGDVPSIFQDKFLWGFKQGNFTGFVGLMLETASHNHYVRVEPLYSWVNTIYVSRIIRRLSSMKMVHWVLKKRNVEFSTIAEIGEDLEEPAVSLGLRNELSAAFDYIMFRFGWRKGKLKGIQLRLVLDLDGSKQSSLSLSDNLDPTGYPKINTHLVISQTAVDSAEALVRKFGEIYEELGGAKLQYQSFDKIDWGTFVDASHHLGGLRMCENLKEAVLDKHQRVIGLKNFFVAGAPIFPTSGSSNPVYTILALNIRLANYIKSIIDSKKCGNC